MVLVRRVHFSGSTQVALVLGGFLGEDVALECLGTLDAAAGADLEALGRAALGFQLGHLHDSCFVVATGGPCGALVNIGTTSSDPLRLALLRDDRLLFLLRYMLD